MPPQVLSRSQGDFFLRGLTSNPPQRSDGRHLLAFRSLDIDTGVAAQANGSSQITLGGTEIFCGIKAEVSSFGDDSDDEDGEAEFQTQDELDLASESRKTGRIKCSVDYSQSLVHSFDSKVLDSLSISLSSMVNSAFSPRSSPLPLHQLLIIANAKHWTIYIDLLVNSLSGGNLFDAAFAAIFAAFYDTRVPVTRGVAFEAPATIDESGNAVQGAFANAQGDLDQMGIKGLLKKKPKGSAAATSKKGSGSDSKVVDFELEHSGEDGAALDGRQNLPLCITVNILPNSYLLDADVDEEACVGSRVQVLATRTSKVLSVRTEGTEEISFKRVSEAIRIGSVQAARLAEALLTQLSRQADADDQDEQVQASAHGSMDVDA
ncbi:Exoribonuclease, phosphorolytic domain 1 [Kalmanozyma brasiliensis GHG001]|uniref:Ribosomal RNA-processing protein 42 n=1 Tax=Kalmanozyma brasiliensis (strain GHG001) TaxID=1365824 RepID=V5GW25_KALBG|nr:Exoribonuclease, phosphorolytic domain 1 [Kalmanozyma brasiliensis GHG001]EST10072.1 Exoribonuclease, phosphorolytic domain 1 [Kalmanozyma brasiliensis GHG001]